MKKILPVLIIVVFLFSFTALASDVPPVTVTLDGNVVDCEAYGQSATIVDGRTLVPLRAIFEALGASVEWNNDTKTVTSSLGDTTISLAIGSNELYKNGNAVIIDVPAKIMNGRTMVPARAIAEAFGVNVGWNKETRTVILTTVRYERGTTSDGVYENKWLGFRYVLPKGYSFMQEAELKYQMGLAADVSLDRIDINEVLECYEFRTFNESAYGVSVVVAKNSNNLSTSAYRDESIMKAYNDMGYKYEIKNLYVPEIAGINFDAVDVCVDVFGEEYLMTIAIVEKDGCLVTLIFSYPDEQTYKLQLDGFSSLSQPFEKIEQAGITYDEYLDGLKKLVDLKETDKNTLLTVNGTKISEADVRSAVLNIFSDDKSNDEIIKSVKEHFLVQAAVVSLSKEYGITLPHHYLKMVSEYMDMLYGITGGKVDETLAESGITPYLYYSYFGFNDLKNAFYEHYMTNEEFLSEVMEKTLESIYKKAYVRVKHVLVQFPGKNATDEEKAVTLERAEKIYELAKENPASFDELIKTYGEDPGMTSYTGGYVFTYGKMVEPFENKSFLLKEGEISEPVETDYGYHVIMRIPMDSEGIETTSIVSTKEYSDVFTQKLQDILLEEAKEYKTAYSNNFYKKIDEYIKEAKTLDEK